MKKYILPLLMVTLVFALALMVLLFIYMPSGRDSSPTSIVSSDKASETVDSSKQQKGDAFRIEKVVLAEGEKFSDVLKRFGMTDEKKIKHILDIFNSKARNTIDLDKEAQPGDVIRISLYDGMITKVIIKLADGRKYTSYGNELNMRSNGRWKIDSNSKYDVHLVERSNNLVGDSQYFYVYTGKDKSRKHLDAVVTSIKRSLKARDSFDLYDDFNAAKIAYIEWSSVLFAEEMKKVTWGQEFYDELEQCYNYQLEHSLVGTDNYGTVIFSNYELNDKYQENLRNGIYKKCDPEEFIDSWESSFDFLHFRKGMEEGIKKVIRDTSGKDCQELIRSKYRYVNSLIFEKEIDVDIKGRPSLHSVSGVLRVESTNGDRAKQTYSCTYDREKKELLDWSVGKLELVGD